MSEPATDPEAVVRAFLGDLERLDVDAAADRLAADAVYQNVPFPAARGREAIAKQLEGLARYGSGFEVRYHNVAVNGSTVLTERNDVLVFGPVRADFWVCGTFEVVDGHITLWRDRFDFVDFTLAFVKGGLRALVGLVRGRAS
jgi:limonene-1,2-epoxide hydrolase